ncbi:amino acid ABC transporter permease [Aerococcaceae bacterium DSM 111020]|nr:amino acid ABC transporter permease [Aerococcaceae bacterium DSM 111020]
MINLFQTYWPMLLEGLKNTLIASAIALVGSLIIGTLMAIMELHSNRVIARLATAYVEFFRNIPLLIIVMFFYVAVPLYGFPISGFWAGVIGLTIYTSSFIADNVRAGILSIDKGQREAGLSQGLTEDEVMRYIVLPQAARKVLPPLGNQTINLVKNSSILAMVAGLDLMYYGDLVASETFLTIDTYVLVGILYLFITVPLTIGIQRIERHLGDRY